MSAVFTLEGQKEILDQLISDLGSNCKLGLYKARSGTGKNVAYSDLTLADFSGYAVTTPTWATGTTDGNNKYNRVGTTSTFTHNGGGTSNTIIGYCVYDSATSKLLFYEDFGAPVSMSASGNTITVTPTWYLGDASTPL